MWRRLSLVLVIALSGLGLTPAAAASPAGPEAPAAGVVGNGSPGSCDESALDDALSFGGAVTFNCGAGAVTIPIVNEKMIAGSTVIYGGGLITITGGLTTRLFRVQAGGSLELNDLVLDSGFKAGEGGGGIVNAGTLRLNHVTIRYSQADGGHSGGAVYTYGPTYISNSSFHHNEAGYGGAIHALDTTVVIVDSDLAINEAIGLNGQGGAILVRYDASVFLANDTFENNYSDGDGGAIYNRGNLTANNVSIGFNSTVTDVSASFRGFGGAIASTGSLTLTDSSLYGNHSRFGGGLFVGQETLPPTALLQHVGVVANTALYSGGGIYASTATTATTVLTLTDTSVSSNTANFGGGISRNNAPVNIFRSTLGENHADSGGGLGSSGSADGGPVRIYDSTIYSNVITSTQGAAIYHQGLMDLRNLTIEGNDTGLYVSGAGSELTIANTVLHNVGDNCQGILPSSLGGNFASDTTCLLGSGPGDVQDAGLDPLLGELEVSYMLLTQFFRPLPGSPLINAATYPCSLRDQAGAYRPDACDRGAVEFHGLLPGVFLPVVLR